MSDGYTKLFASILDSTVWAQPNHVKLMWVTMLAMKGHDGVVEASIPGLARRAGVTIPEAEDALRIFMSPDPYSRSKDLEGRRIVEVDGGWAMVNHAKYKHKASEEDTRERAAARQKAFRERDKAKREPKTEPEEAKPDFPLRTVTERDEALRVTENNDSNDIRGRSESDQNREDQILKSETPTPSGGGVGVRDDGSPQPEAKPAFRRNASLSGSHHSDFDLAFGEAAEALDWKPAPGIGHQMRAKVIERCREYAHSASVPFLDACRVISREGLVLARATSKSPASALLEVEPGKGPPRRFGNGRPERAAATTGKDFADAAPIAEQLKRLKGET